MAMLEQTNLLLARKNFEAMTTHDLDQYGATMDEGHVWESDTLPMVMRGRAAAQQAMAGYYQAFPDIRFDVERDFATGDYAVVCWRALGTQQGELMGIPPTGRPIDIHGCSIFEVHDGQITHAWTYWDTGKLL